MSGGRFNYTNEQIAYEMEGEWQDDELNELFYDLFCSPVFGIRGGGLAKALDFWICDDTGEEAYRKRVKEFKDKWFGRTPEDRVEFYQGKLQERCDELKRELAGGLE